jgi:hypothetical protein
MPTWNQAKTVELFEIQPLDLFVCAPATMPVGEVEAEVSKTIKGQWHAHPSRPCGECPTDAQRIHWHMECYE